MNANIMCEYSREEWLNGLTRMGTDSLDKLRAKLPELRGELRDPARFQEVYNFAFSWAREVGLQCCCRLWVVGCGQLQFQMHLQEVCNFAFSSRGVRLKGLFGCLAVGSTLAVT
jgi:hypothetical protein